MVAEYYNQNGGGFISRTFLKLYIDFPRSYIVISNCAVITD